MSFSTVHEHKGEMTPHSLTLENTGFPDDSMLPEFKTWVTLFDTSVSFSKVYSSLPLRYLYPCRGYV